MNIYTLFPAWRELYRLGQSDAQVNMPKLTAQVERFRQQGNRWWYPLAKRVGRNVAGAIVANDDALDIRSNHFAYLAGFRDACQKEWQKKGVTVSANTMMPSNHIGREHTYNLVQVSFI